jgi:hypothetical protein
MKNLLLQLSAKLIAHSRSDENLIESRNSAPLATSLLVMLIIFYAEYSIDS